MFAIAIIFATLSFLALFIRALHPFAISLSYTIAIGIFAGALFLLPFALYAFGQIGKPEVPFTKADRRRFIFSIIDYYEPGCLYDCRVVQNRIDVLTLVYTVVVALALTIALMWLDAGQHDRPAYDTPAGVRYTNSQVAILLILSVLLWAIVNGVWAFYQTAVLVPETVRPNPPDPAEKGVM